MSTLLTFLETCELIIKVITKKQSIGHNKEMQQRDVKATGRTTSIRKYSSQGRRPQKARATAQTSQGHGPPKEVKSYRPNNQPLHVIIFKAIAHKRGGSGHISKQQSFKTSWMIPRESELMMRTLGKVEDLRILGKHWVLRPFGDHDLMRSPKYIAFLVLLLS